jgi:hypothetical protein
MAAAGCARRLRDKRIRVVWPGRFAGDRGNTKLNYVSAALAGLRSGVCPHQDLTGVEIAGIHQLLEQDEAIDGAILEMLTEHGVWVLEDCDAHIVTRSAVTTAEQPFNDDSTQAMDAVVTNVDAISKCLRKNLGELMAAAPAKTDVVALARVRIKGQLNKLSSNRPVRQLVRGVVTGARRHSLMAGLVVSVQLDVPVPPACSTAWDDGVAEVHQQIIA